jgi:hypothetical protein
MKFNAFKEFIQNVHCFKPQISWSYLNNRLFLQGKWKTIKKFKNKLKYWGSWSFAKKFNDKRKTEAQAIFLGQLSICKQTKRSKRTCPSMVKRYLFFRPFCVIPGQSFWSHMYMPPVAGKRLNYQCIKNCT